MSDEVTPATQAAPQGTTAPETPAIETPAATSGEQQTSQPDVPPSQEPEAPQRQPWFQRRIDELTKARRETERENEALRALVAERNPAQQPNQPTQPPADPYVLAKQIAQQQTLNDAANRTYEAGKAAYGDDFDAAVKGLQQVTDLSRHQDFLEAVTSLPNAHDVYHYLGKNPDEAAHVLSLGQVKMTLELATLSAKVGRPKPQSHAAPPITPVGKSATPSSDLSDDLPTAEWIERRQAQIDKRRG